jgi:hypothetical protein
MAGGGGAPKSIGTLINEAEGPVLRLRSSDLAPYIFPGIPPEFTTWCDEVRAWQNAVTLPQQSYHMTELHLRDRHVIAFRSQPALDKFDPFYYLETIGSLGSSLVSDRIEDNYADPIEVGYGRQAGPAGPAHSPNVTRSGRRQPVAYEGHTRLERRRLRNDQVLTLRWRATCCAIASVTRHRPYRLIRRAAIAPSSAASHADSGRSDHSSAALSTTTT